MSRAKRPVGDLKSRGPAGLRWAQSRLSGSDLRAHSLKSVSTAGRYHPVGSVHGRSG